MPATVLEQHYRDRMQSIQQIVFHQTGPSTLTGRVVEDLASLCVELSEAGRQLLELEYERIFKEPDLSVAWLQERRQVIEELSNTFVELVTAIKRAAPSDAGASAGKGLVGRLDEAVQRLVEIKENVLARWPVGSPEEIAQARATSPGDYLGADEAFAQIAGVNVEIWRQRVENHKQARQD